jgi:hypothetical protein
MSKAKHYRAKSNAYGELSKGPETTHGLRAGGIDEFVHRTLLSGFLHKNEVLAHYLPEFARTFSRTEEIGAGCPPTRTRQAADGFPEAVPQEPAPDWAEPVFGESKTNDPD